MNGMRKTVFCHHEYHSFALAVVGRRSLGWINREQYAVIAYLQEENRVLREQLGKKRLRFTDDQRRRLAAKAKGLGGKLLRELGIHCSPKSSATS